MSELPSTYIRSTSHSLKFANAGKRYAVADFLTEYRKAVDVYVEVLWNCPREWTPGKILDVEHDYLDVPSMISTTDIPIDTKLSGRALKCAATQACGMVKAALRRRKLDLEIRQKCIDGGKSIPKRVAYRLDHKSSMPRTAKTNAEINSICCSVQDGEHTTFSIWVELKSMFSCDEYARGYSIQIPLKRTKMDDKWRKGEHEVLPSILLSDDAIHIRYRRPVPECKGEKVTGLDQGVRRMLTASDGTVIPDEGHGYKHVLQKIARKKRGSKAYKRALNERENYVCHSINQVDWSVYKLINLERHFDIKRGRRTSRVLTAFSNPQIRNVLYMRTTEELGVPLQEVDNVCNSLRCPMDGWVHVKNRPRKGVVFRCCKCGYVDDADEVGAINANLHSEGLPDCSHALVFTWKLHKKSGFFWANEGFFDENGNPISVVGSSQSPTGLK